MPWRVRDPVVPRDADAAKHARIAGTMRCEDRWSNGNDPVGKPQCFQRFLRRRTLAGARTLTIPLGIQAIGFTIPEPPAVNLRRLLLRDEPYAPFSIPISIVLHPVNIDFRSWGANARRADFIDGNHPAYRKILVVDATLPSH